MPDIRTDAPIRRALLEAAARLIATEGAAALTLRRVAAEVGTSTMAVYTYFGGMPELRRAVRREGFARLAERLADIRPGDDAVADLAMIGLAYYANALANPDLYRVMLVEHPLDPQDAEAGLDTFATLVAGVQRCADAGRFTVTDAPHVATQFWALAHGVVTLHLAGFLPADESSDCFRDATVKLFVGCGDAPADALRSFAVARRRAARPEPEDQRVQRPATRG